MQTADEKIGEQYKIACQCPRGFAVDYQKANSLEQKFLLGDVKDLVIVFVKRT